MSRLFFWWCFVVEHEMSSKTKNKVYFVNEVASKVLSRSVNSAIWDCCCCTVSMSMGMKDM